MPSATINRARFTQALRHIHQYLHSDIARAQTEIVSLKHSCKGTEYEYMTAEIHQLVSDFKLDLVEECITLLLEDLE